MTWTFETDARSDASTHSGGWTHGASASYPAIPDSVRAVRNVVAELAERAGADRDQFEAIRLAVSEAATNVVIHAYEEDTRGMLHLSASAADGELMVLIADDGHGHRVRTQSPGMGWGWKLIADACDRLTILERGSGGTELRMHWRIRRDHGRRRTRGDSPACGSQSRGSERSATSPASPRFSTTR
jgi:anti-sigma regulatory factor (Ser/Thr protein kinase)